MGRLSKDTPQHWPGWLRALLTGPGVRRGSEQDAGRGVVRSLVLTRPQNVWAAARSSSVPHSVDGERGVGGRHVATVLPLPHPKLSFT